MQFDTVFVIWMTDFKTAFLNHILEINKIQVNWILFQIKECHFKRDLHLLRQWYMLEKSHLTLIYIRAIRLMFYLSEKNGTSLQGSPKWQGRINNQLLTKQKSLTAVFSRRKTIWIWDNSWKFLEFILKRLETSYIFQIYAGESSGNLNEWKGESKFVGE